MSPNGSHAPDGTPLALSKEPKVDSGKDEASPDREHWHFPVIDPIKHLSDMTDGKIKYNYYATRPKGLRNKYEPDYKWSLHKNDWFYIKTTPHTLTLANRSMLTEMGIKNEELPPISTEDSEETRGFPNEPMPLEDLHRQKGKHNETCSWRNIGRTKGVVPKLDRYMNSLKRIKTLIVHDPDGVIPSSRHSATDKSIRYCQRDAKRLNVPWVEPPPEENAMVAHLHLSRSKKLGSGNAGEVFQATFDIPHIIADEMFWYCCHETGKGGKDFEPCDYVANASGDLNLDGIPTRFTVAAWLTLDFSGYQVVSPIHVPQAACALVPKSYGCWVPEVINSKMSNGYPVNRYNVESLSPILLLEECGRPTVEGGLSGNEKKLWWSMLLRFHRHGFVQRSIYPRNLLVQPGPLTAAPEERSMKRPSFRLIDFGRGLVRSEEKETEHCFTEFKEAIAKDQKNLVALLGLGREESFDGFLSPP